MGQSTQPYTNQSNQSDKENKNSKQQEQQSNDKQVGKNISSEDAKTQSKEASKNQDA